ncbi:MAG: uridine diphosphate-N-acetylglucosamine-binding protein YvcK [Anaerolineaceae bacterium]
MSSKGTGFTKKISHGLNRVLRWFIPGLGVKRWVLVVLAGTTLLGIGLAVLVLDIYRNAPETWWLPVLSFLSLRFLDRTLRFIIFGGLGLAMVVYGLIHLNRALIRPLLKPGQPMVEKIEDYRRRERGPKIVALGGGHGLATLLHGLKTHTRNLTAIVTVTDEGGSSGELRRSTGILPPGDVRNCLIALSDDEALIGQIFQYRFTAGTGLEGHSLGNLFLTAMTDLTGSFEEAVAEAGRVLAVQGKVLPATLHDVRLKADIVAPDSTKRMHVKGEISVVETVGKVHHIWLEPDNPKAFPPAIQAILGADLIVVGPGSLYTSLLPNLLVPEIGQAIQTSKALKFYVCNVATQEGETDGYSGGDHIHAIEQHLSGHIFDLIVCNNRCQGELIEGVEYVTMEPEIEDEYALYQAPLADDLTPWRHDSGKLAEVIMDLYYERTGPLANGNKPSTGVANEVS